MKKWVGKICKIYGLTHNEDKKSKINEKKNLIIYKNKKHTKHKMKKKYQSIKWKKNKSLKTLKTKNSKNTHYCISKYVSSTIDESDFLILSNFGSSASTNDIALLFFCFRFLY